ncbi:hypothetical protein D8674_005238 [Pyrus ussuriensis x Pyrus communis]|uniref:Uncharacterized protein n=1 Tax=Pyrus ussuriensis x Pyrus communis TaxID=2448454 RepID=A0A5N5FVC0_9ROSA|nr:hypothetical protein D8674_005238 [Pyrus ussuriensis x Pyrus communis]
MAQTVRGFIVMPKTNIVQISSCESYRHRPVNTPQITHARRNISHSIKCGGKSRPPISKGGGGKINGTTKLRERNVSDQISSSKTDQNDGKQTNGDAKTTTKTGSTG